MQKIFDQILFLMIFFCFCNLSRYIHGTSAVLLASNQALFFTPSIELWRCFWRICLGTFVKVPEVYPKKTHFSAYRCIGYLVFFQHKVVKHYYFDWETWLHDLEVQNNGKHWWTQKALGWCIFLWLSIGGEGITRSDQNMDLCKSLVWACFSAKTWIADISICIVVDWICPSR